jgi:hypothetical protein
VAKGNQLVALLRSHLQGDDEQFRSVALQIAAQEARAGRVRLATELRDLVDEAELKHSVVERCRPATSV